VGCDNGTIAKPVAEKNPPVNPLCGCVASPFMVIEAIASAGVEASALYHTRVRVNLDPIA
jgi:hypothetical protein